MALGVSPAKGKIDELMAQLAQLSPEELADVTADMQEDVDDLNDGHLDVYQQECVKESYEADEDRRAKDDTLWAAHETQMAEMADKEDWQSKIVLNTPFTTVMQAKSLVRKGLMDRPDYFGLNATDPDNEETKLKAAFWEKNLKFWTSRKDSFLPYTFADAAEMGFTTGQSSAIKVMFKPDENGIYRLRLPLIEPWKTYPDPDRQPRLAWSGLYNIHEEWVDFYQLKELETQGYYQNIDQVKIGKSQKDGAGYNQEDKEQERRRKGQTLHRNRFRKSVLVREFWGTILDEDGDVIMPSGTFTTCNGVVIRKARPCPFKRMRWPWVDFSPIPHVLRFHGYGLFEGVMAVWKFQNALLNLFIDNENWRINNMFEIDPNNLDDPSDLEIYPLKAWILKRMAEGKPAVRPILKGDSNIQDVQFMWGLVTNLWENGSMVTELLKGDQGSRKDITATEIQLKMQQSLGVFDSIGKDVEQGGTNLLWAIKEVLTTFQDQFTEPSLAEYMGQDPFYLQMVQSAGGAYTWQQRQQDMELDCDIDIHGVSRLFKTADELQKWKELAMLGKEEMFAAYIKPYVILTKIADKMNVEEGIKDEQEIVQDAQQQQQEQNQQAVSAAIENAMKAGTDAHVQTHGHVGKGGAPPEFTPEGVPGPTAQPAPPPMVAGGRTVPVASAIPQRQ
jgi:hypothetical protein